MDLWAASTFSTSPDTACVSAAQPRVAVSRARAISTVIRFIMRCFCISLLSRADRRCRELGTGCDPSLFGPTQRYGCPLQLGVIPGKFFDFDELICAYVGEVLPRIAGWPPDLQ